MIPAFDQYGLLPPGIWDCTLDDIAGRFCWNPHRRALLDGFRRFLREIFYPLNLSRPIYIDGSFVRDKALPSDVDIIIEVFDINDTEALVAMLPLRFDSARLKAVYNVEMMVRCPGLDQDILAFFQYAGLSAAAELGLPPQHPKGILRLQ